MNHYVTDTKSIDLSQHLDSDEQLLWAARPKQGIKLSGADFFLIPFSLMWGGFAIFWMIMAFGSGAPAFFPLFGTPFVIIGLYMIIGRFFFDAKRRSKTIYGLTNNRIIIKSGVFSTNIKSLNIRSLSDVSMNEKSDGTGTIVLGNDPMFGGFMRGTGMPGTNMRLAPALECIQNVRDVYRQIIDLQKA